jgi:hypothetical protein
VLTFFGSLHGTKLLGLIVRSVAHLQSTGLPAVLLIIGQRRRPSPALPLRSGWFLERWFVPDIARPRMSHALYSVVTCSWRRSRTACRRAARRSSRPFSIGCPSSRPRAG